MKKEKETNVKPNVKQRTRRHMFASDKTSKTTKAVKNTETVTPAAKDVDFSKIILPPSVVSKKDVARLIDEIEFVDNAMTTKIVRAKIGKRNNAKLSFSAQLSDFVSKNELSLDDSKERRLILRQLRVLKDTAPVAHLTFATPADYQSLQQLAKWFRSAVGPQVIIEEGLQPALIAGVYVRTTNHIHDFSVRATLREKRSVLIDDIGRLNVKK